MSHLNKAVLFAAFLLLFLFFSLTAAQAPAVSMSGVWPVHTTLQEGDVRWQRWTLGKETVMQTSNPGLQQTLRLMEGTRMVLEIRPASWPRLPASQSVGSSSEGSFGVIRSSRD